MWMKISFICFKYLYSLFSPEILSNLSNSLIFPWFFSNSSNFLIPLWLEKIISLFQFFPISSVNGNPVHSFILREVYQCSRVVLSEAVDWCINFALPKKSNMAVTENDPYPMVRKMSWALTSELSMWAWDWNVTDSNIFDLIIPRYFPIWQSKEMFHDFVRGQSMAETAWGVPFHLQGGGGGIRVKG